MRVLIADDDPVSLRALQATLVRWGYEVAAAVDGAAAWGILEAPDAPKLAILDWMMPGLDGVEICRRLRAAPHAEPAYVLLLTVRGRRTDIVKGLEAGADDYVTKPFDRAELRARLQAGVRIVELQQRLKERVRELEAALRQVRQLHGLLPICSYCKRVRDDRNYWQQVERYVTDHSGAQFSHGICPDCYEEEVRPQLQRLAKRKGRAG